MTISDQNSQLLQFCSEVNHETAKSGYRCDSRQIQTTEQMSHTAPKHRQNRPRMVYRIAGFVCNAAWCDLGLLVRSGAYSLRLASHESVDHLWMSFSSTCAQELMQLYPSVAVSEEAVLRDCPKKKSSESPESKLQRNRHDRMFNTSFWNTDPGSACYGSSQGLTIDSAEFMAYLDV